MSLSENQIDEKLKKMFFDVFEIKDIDLNSSMDEIPEWDSFKHFELIVSLEKEFQIKLKIEDSTEITSIPIIKSKLVKYLNEN